MQKCQSGGKAQCALANVSTHLTGYEGNVQWTLANA